MIRTAVWLGATLAIAVGAIAISDDRFDETGAQLACTGPVSRQLDNALFTARGLSQSGEDPVCTPPAADTDDDDFDGGMLSHRHGSGDYQARRR